MVSGAARSPLPITGIARAHTRPKLNFSSGFVRCAPVYLCIARNRISPRWRAIPAACNLTLPRPPSATISSNLLPSYSPSPPWLKMLHNDLSKFVNNDIQCERLPKSKLTRFVYFGFSAKFLTITQWLIYRIYPSRHSFLGLQISFVARVELLIIFLDLTFWDVRSFNSVICRGRDSWRSFNETFFWNSW